MDPRLDGKGIQQNVVSYMGQRAERWPQLAPLAEYLRGLSPLDDRLQLIDSSTSKFPIWQWLNFAKQTGVHEPAAWVDGYVAWIDGRLVVD